MKHVFLHTLQFGAQYNEITPRSMSMPFLFPCAVSVLQHRILEVKHFFTASLEHASHQHDHTWSIVTPHRRVMAKSKTLKAFNSRDSICTNIPPATLCLVRASFVPLLKHSRRDRAHCPYGTNGLLRAGGGSGHPGARQPPVAYWHRR